MRLMRRAKVVSIREPGGPEVLALDTRAIREPGPGEVLVEVAAAGLNRADCLQRKGFYPAPPGVWPDVPGLEFAGVVAEVGPEVRAVAKGDRVMGICGGAGMSTLLLAHERELVPVPAGMSLTDAAAVPEVFFTAYDALFAQAGLGVGQVALLHAVGSGIGTAALQLCLAAGATPIGTSRSAEKLARCEALGLRHGVLAGDAGFAAGVLAIAEGGAHVILDTVGAKYLEENVKAVATSGRIVTIGLLGGAKGPLPLGALLAKRAHLSGSVLRSRPFEEKIALAQAFRRDVLPLLEDGRVRPIVDAVLPIDDVQEAHRRMEANETFGKLVLAF
jgi:putative PIG3 family NAD(P)H quinone oxidoreductase